MKVKELIAQLHLFDPNQEVFCYTEDEALTPPGHNGRLLGITEISTEDGEKAKGEDGITFIKAGKTEESKIYVLFEVTSDF
jgi:hypothetical protein